MHVNRPLVAVAAVAAGMLATSAVVLTTAAEGNGGSRVIRAQLSGFQENPLALSSDGVGHFRARIDPGAGTITYRLSYDSLEGSVTQAHIHFGSPSQVGGVAAFLCSNLGNGPVGTQACPASPGVITGTIRAADVIGPAAQGIAAGEFNELLAAIRADTTYVNVHSDLYPIGEIRSQLEHAGHH
jgi:hypothetical protein